MTWALVVVMLASVAYVVRIVGKYKTFLEQVEPRIERLEQEAEEFEKEIGVEEALRRENQEQLRGIEELMSDLNRGITTTKAQLVQVQRRGEELETEKYRQEFKRNRP